ncbi:MAG: hypothetical protein B7Y82_06145 [Sphingomonadales bacterium 32-65-25]|nr:MAG: hypothetical protein B7Y82_06145 [Sphingomonadales bacterium 32-65-25]
MIEGTAPTLAGTPAGWGNAVRWPAAMLALALGLLPLIVTPVLPLIDFYNHVARFQVLATLADNPLFAANYAAAWAILPNVGLDVIAVAALQIVPLALLPHLLTVLILAVLFAGILALNRAITGQVRWPALLLALPLLYSWIFNWGFANFLLGLGLALLAAAWWVNQRDRPVRRVAFALLLALAIFFCHALAFGLFGILIASLELGHWWLQRPRRFAALVKALGQCALLAVVPAILFLQSRTATAAGGVSNADESLARLRAQGLLMDRLAELAAQRLETIVRVAEGPSYPADAFWLLLLVALLGLAFKRRALLLAPLVVVPAMAGLVLVLVMPPALFGSGYVSDRMPLFLALVLVAGIMPGPGRLPLLLPGLATLVGARLLMLAVQWHGAAADLADFDAVARALPPGQVVAGLPVRATPHEDMPGRCEMYPPLLLLRHGHATPLFAIRTAQPLELRGRLGAARDELSQRPAGLQSRQRPELVIAAYARAGYPYVLLCQVAADRPLPATSYPVVAQAGRFRLLRLASEP